MAKTKKEKNIRKEKNGKYYIDFTFNKNRIRKFGGYTKEQARNTLTKLKMQCLNKKMGFETEKKPDILFKDFADEFMDLYSKQNKRSWKRDETSLKHLKPYFKGKTLQEMKPDLIERYKAKRKAEITQRKTKTSVATINREITLLKTIFNKAIEWGRIDKNQLAKIKKFKENQQKEMRILKDEEAIRLIDSAASHLKPILILALNTGMRRGEILSLKWENLDFKKGLIFIENSKSGKSRNVYMNSLIFETLKELPKNSEFVFFNEKTGTHIKDVKTAFKAVCRRVGIKNFRFHDLRHQAATKMVEAGVDIATVSKILGHSSITMTMRYAHPGEKTMREAAEKLGKIYDQTRQKVDTPTETVIIRKPVKHLYEYN